MGDKQTISIAIASASVVVGVVYYALQLRHQNRMRQTDLVIRLSSSLGNLEFSKVLVKIATSEAEDLDIFVEECSPEGLPMVARAYALPIPCRSVISMNSEPGLKIMI